MLFKFNLKKTGQAQIFGKDWTGRTLLRLAANTEISGVHLPLRSCQNTQIALSCLSGTVAASWMMAQARGDRDVPSEPLGDFYWSMRQVTNACNFTRVSAATQLYEREPWTANWQLNMNVVRRGLLLTKGQEGIAVAPSLVDSL